MRIAYVCADRGVPVFGRKGSSVHVQELIRAFLRSGATVNLFAARTDGTPPAELSQMPVHEIPISRFGDCFTRERSMRDANLAFHAALETAGRFDLVYERHALWSTAAMEYARAQGVAGLLEVNAPLIEEQVRYRDLADRAHAERATRRAFSAASTLIVVSKAIVQYVQQYGGRSAQVHVVPNGVDPARFPSGLARSVAARKGNFRVGFLGSLKPWHGLRTLVEAFARLHREAPDATLLIVGDGPERQSLIADLSGRGLLSAVHLTGSVSPSQVPGLLASLDVGLAPYCGTSDFYFSPMKIYEYMAAGLPVIASDIGQIAELIADDIDGLLCAPEDPDAFTRALFRLRADPELRTRLGAAARRKIVKHHSWDTIARRVLDLARLVPVSEATA